MIDKTPIALLLWMLASTIIGCVLYYFIARKKQFVDIPNERSSHTHQPVRGMGIAILAPLLVLTIWFPGDYLLHLGIGVAVITGYLDDRFNLRAFIRLPLYLGALILSTYEILWADGALVAPLWMTVAMVIVALGLINTYNFMDGINGITSLYSIVFFMTTLSIYIAADGSFYPAYPELVSALLFFVVVFSVFNLRTKALAFMGDSGSVSLGLMVSTVLISIATAYDMWPVIVLVAVYGVDSVGTIILRLIRRENIFEAHRSHLYQDLVHVKGWSHLGVSILYAVLQLAINILCFKPIVNGSLSATWTLGILALLSLMYVLVKKSLNQLNFKNTTND